MEALMMKHLALIALVNFFLTTFPHSDLKGSSTYMRPIPDSLTPLVSDEGRKILKEIVTIGCDKSFWRLIEQFSTQQEPTFCGLTTLAMTLNALKIDPQKNWKGIWRWYDEYMLLTTHELQRVRERGLNLRELSELATKNNLIVESVYSDKISLEQFKKILKRNLCSEDKFIIASYSRKVLGQTGDGHFSPIAAYHEKYKKVLILDVARFKYPPVWVDIHKFKQAMDINDSSTQKSRGLILVSKK